MVESDEDVIIAASNFVSERLCPVFQVSNVTGLNLNYLKSFLNLLNSRAPNHDNCPKEFQIDEIYSVPVRAKYGHSCNSIHTDCVLF